MVLFCESGNVAIGKEQDNGEKLQVNGNISSTKPINVKHTGWDCEPLTLMAIIGTGKGQLKTQILTGYSQAEIDSFYRQVNPSNITTSN